MGLAKDDTAKIEELLEGNEKILGPRAFPPGTSETTVLQMIKPAPPPGSARNQQLTRANGFEEDSTSSEGEDDQSGPRRVVIVRSKRERGTPSNSDSDLTDTDDEIPAVLDLHNPPPADDVEDSSDSD